MGEEKATAVPKTYENPRYPYRRSPDQDASAPVRHPVVIVGAGLVGLALAVDLAQRGIGCLLLDDDDTVSFGSRAICFAKRSLEIADRLGIGQRLLNKGITWSRGKVFFRDSLAYAFDLLPEGGHRFPAFVNLQQYYAEEWLIERAVATGRVEIRWKNRVTGVTPSAEGVAIEIETPEGPYRLEAGWLLACDGAHSQVRRELGLAFEGQVFQDRFLICDVVMQADFPTERWFWFDPPFHPGQSALLHRQADNVWRIDLQLGWDADPEEEIRPERVIARLRAMLGEDRPFEIDWVSVYTFKCRRLARFRHGRVLFAGDSAHQVSPFGARGGNGGLQDADNLAWKLALVLQGRAPEALLDSYDAERIPAADENILHSTRATDFITPKNAATRAYRDAVLELATDHPFARRLVNSGRLSLPCALPDSPLNTPDTEAFAGPLRPGCAALDAPVMVEGRKDWLLRHTWDGFTLLCFADADHPPPSGLATLASDPVPIRPLMIAPAVLDAGGPLLLLDAEGLAGARYDGQPGSCFLLRPDQQLCARWRAFSAASVRAARDRALALPQRNETRISA